MGIFPETSSQLTYAKPSQATYGLWIPLLGHWPKPGEKLLWLVRNAICGHQTVCYAKKNKIQKKGDPAREAI